MKWFERFRWLGISWVLLLVVVPGCSVVTYSDKPVRVTGTVTISGRALAYGVVEFHSRDDEQLSRTAMVQDGKFSLDENAGLTEGDYAVRVLPYEPEVEELSQFTDEQRRAIQACRHEIPARFQNRGALDAQLAAEDPNTLTFDLNG